MSQPGIWGALFGAPTPVLKTVAVSVAPAPEAVVRDNRPLLEKRGWQSKGKNHVAGHYATSFGTFAGEIRGSWNEWTVWIKDPPMQYVAKHPHHCCFHKHTNGWWTIHLAKNPADGDINSILAYVERLLEEARRLAGGK